MKKIEPRRNSLEMLSHYIHFASDDDGALVNCIRFYISAASFVQYETAKRQSVLTG